MSNKGSTPPSETNAKKSNFGKWALAAGLGIGTIGTTVAVTENSVEITPSRASAMADNDSEQSDAMKRIKDLEKLKKRFETKLQNDLEQGMLPHVEHQLYHEQVLGLLDNSLSAPYKSALLKNAKLEYDRIVPELNKAQSSYNALNNSDEEKRSELESKLEDLESKSWRYEQLLRAAGVIKSDAALIEEIKSDARKERESSYVEIYAFHDIEKINAMAKKGALTVIIKPELQESLKKSRIHPRVLANESYIDAPGSPNGVFRVTNGIETRDCAVRGGPNGVGNVMLYQFNVFKAHKGITVRPPTKAEAVELERFAADNAQQWLKETGAESLRR